MQTEFQCSYSLQLLLGNQHHIPAAHFHVYSFAFPSGNVLVLLHLATTTDSNLAYITGSPRSKEKKKRREQRESPPRESPRREPARESHAPEEH